MSDATRAADEIERLRAVIETKVARFMCPVHGSAGCPEDYMLYTMCDEAGLPMPQYRDVYQRCGQRFTIAAALGDSDEPR